MDEGWIDYGTWRDGSEHTVSGLVLVRPRIGGPQLEGERDVLVYLPPSLVASGPHTDRRYPVLYFHDGQNVFDEHTSFSGEWHADETLELLAGEGIEAIAVAIPNGGASRMDDYNPWRDSRRRMGGKGDAYLGFLVGRVKPLIDARFPTRPERSATGIVGSSMGGLISLYALAAYPGVFGMAGVMSPSLGWSNYRVLELIEAGMLTGAPRPRIHVDAGGREWKGMLPDARRLRDLLREQGFSDGRDLQYVEERRAMHNEAAWARRLPDALRFLLAQTRSHAPKGDVTRDGSPVPLYRRLSAGEEPRIVHESIGSASTILELGAGAGRVTHPLIALGHSLVAVDESAEMLRWISGAETVAAPIEGLDLGREFDAVLLGSHLVNTADDGQREEFLRTCARHVSPTGVVLIEHHATDWADTAAEGSSDRDGVAVSLAELRRHPPFVSAVMIYEVEGRVFRQRFTARVLSTEDLAGELERTGLRIERELTPTWTTAMRATLSP